MIYHGKNRFSSLLFPKAPLFLAGLFSIKTLHFKRLPNYFGTLWKRLLHGGIFVLSFFKTENFKTHNMSVSVEMVAGQIGNSNLMTVRFTDDGTGANDLVRLPLFGGAGKITDRALEGTTTMSKDYALKTDFDDFFQRVACRVKSMKIMTDSPNDNFNNQIVFGYNTPSRKNQKESLISLDNFATTVGNNYANSLTLNGLDWLILPNFYATLYIKKGSYIEFEMMIDAVAQTANISPTQF